MKTLIITAMGIAIFSCVAKKRPQSKEFNILFVGNSLTYYNDMPQTLQKMFDEQNLPYRISQSTFPGISLTQHLQRKAIINDRGTTDLTPLSLGDTSTTVKVLYSRKWDLVILQDGTVRLLIPEVRNLLVIPAILTIKDILKNNQSDCVLFKTWPSLDTFPKQHCYPSAVVDKSIKKEKCCSPVMNSIEGEARLINSGYDTVGLVAKIPTVPATDCFMDILKHYPNINLYQDKSHPSKLGAYLNACLFFKYITKQKAIKIKYTAGFDKETVEIIQGVVDKYYP